VAATGTVDSGPAQAGLVMSELMDFEHGITAVDTHYVRPRLDASHLIRHGGRAAFVDTGTTLSVPYLLAALEARGVAREAVDWVFLTHIHLDHAGGAGALLEALPNARAAVHPRGAGHLADPAKLIVATRQVYGDALYERLYGEIRPIPAERLVVPTDGAELGLAGRKFRFVHTPGHALHHQAIHDPLADAVFTGDTFGIAYRELDVAGRPFLMPTTTPTQFDPLQLHASIERVLALRPAALFLTHYSRVTDVARLGEELHAALDAYVGFAERHAADPDPIAGIVADMTAWAWGVLDARGHPADEAARRALLDEDIRLNADGLLAWLVRRGPAAATARLPEGQGA
jgi:glyoxylase-like metal-dependent hydrolase (beta-lactamase superfamily II)